MITLYTTHCAQCVVLERKLAQKGIKYTEVDDVIEMNKLGILSVPCLKVDDEPLKKFKEAVEWVNSQPNKE